VPRSRHLTLVEHAKSAFHPDRLNLRCNLCIRKRSTGKPLDRSEAGIDVHFDSQGSYLEVSGPRMYYLVKIAVFGSHLLVLEPEASDFVLHSCCDGAGKRVRLAMGGKCADHQRSMRDSGEGESFELHQIQHGYSEHRGHEHPAPFVPVKVRTIPEDDWQQSAARERKTKQDHGRYGHLR
jgi:hypothetical protein